MKITVLVENTKGDCNSALSVEEGLSLHIQTGNKKLLFDTGSSGAFTKNAELLNVYLQDIDIGIISHQHFDHGGGIEHFFEQNHKAVVYLRDCEVRDLYFRLFCFSRYIGLDQDVLKQFEKRFQFVKKNTEILPDVFLITEISNQYPRPKGNRYLFARENGETIPDGFEHELVLVVKEDDGLVVFTGCAHSGLLNMLSSVRSFFPDLKIKAVVGGFHLIGLPLFDTVGGSKKDIAFLARELRGYSIDKLYTGHCTGKRGYRALKSVYGEGLEYLSTGVIVEI